MNNKTINNITEDIIIDNNTEDTEEVTTFSASSSRKTKIKEMIGQSLDYYKTKTNNLFTKVEQENIKQNHMINVLTGELDNDYITKTEEGSVISLDNSKEGMVYIDILEGNTLVNYCTDGSKELTLNGDIDLEGTFVTTTEGVDNGKVDVLCEGNTLVNLASYKHKYQISVGGNGVVASDVFTVTNQTVKNLKGTVIKNYSESGASYIYYQLGRLNMDLLKTSTTYTIILDNKTDFIRGIDLQTASATNKHTLSCKKVNKNMFVITTKDSFEGLDSSNIIIYGHIVNDYKGNIDISVSAVLEGDYTNKVLPTHFEGMKSVGQDDENGHKIEILSQNKNLYKKEDLFRAGYSFGVPIKSTGSIGDVAQFDNGRITIVTKDIFNVGIGGIIPIKNNKSYTISLQNTNIHYTDVKTAGEIKILPLYANEIPVTSAASDSIFINRVKNMNVLDGQKLAKITFDNSDYDYIQYYIGGAWKSGASGTLTMSFENVQIEESDTATSYIISSSNKKQILLNEPLRGLPNGVKDRFVKIGGKCYIERNCGEFTLPSTLNDRWSELGYPPSKTGEYVQFKFYFKDFLNVSAGLWTNNLMLTCDTLPVYDDILHWSGANNSKIGIGGDDNYFMITAKKSLGYFTDLDTLMIWLQNNPTTVVYQLATPIYEPLEINPELITYTDVTHISNNSLIPCNMKVKNSGYSVIIKPSTLYTIALDTNKSGTIGMNLGGVKGTTTNNVLTLTTPATLTDDSLRLYGKGIKGSKVILLEGDKTNWIPSFFEDMKSCFEDKVQSDGSYGIEVVSNNENLFDITKHRLAQRGSVVVTYDEISKTYTVNNTGNSAGNLQGDWGASTFYHTSGKPERYDNLLFLKCKKGDKISIKAKGTFTKIHIMERNNYNSTMKTFTYEQQEVVHTITHECTTRLEIIFIHPTLGTTFIIKDIQIGCLDKVFDDYIEHKSNKIQFSSIEPLRGIGDVKDRFVFKDNKLMIERNCKKLRLTTENLKLQGQHGANTRFYYDVRLLGFDVGQKPLCVENLKQVDFYDKSYTSKSSYLPCYGYDTDWGGWQVGIYMPNNEIKTLEDAKIWLDNNVVTSVWKLAEPTYEEVPFELQRIILEGYENGTLFIDTNIPPTITTTYAGEAALISLAKSNRLKVDQNTQDINESIIPYIMDLDYRICNLQLNSNISRSRLKNLKAINKTSDIYNLLLKDIQSNRLTKEEYKKRIDIYKKLNKITKQEYKELGEIIKCLV